MPDPLSKPRKIGWVLLLLTTLPAGALAIAWVASKIGGCTGALGSGVTCTTMDLGSIIMLAELGIIVMSPLILIFALAAFPLGIYGTYQHIRHSTPTRSIFQEPFLYLVLLGLPLFLMMFLPDLIMGFFS